MLMGMSPHISSDYGMFVNLDLAEEYGIADELPLYGTDRWGKWPIEELIASAEKATEIGSDGRVKVYGWHHAAGRPGRFRDIERWAVTTAGGKIFDDEWTYEPKEAMINSPEALHGLGILIDSIDEPGLTSPDPATAEAMAGPRGLFRSGLVVMQQSHCMADVLADVHPPVMNLGICLAPTIKRPIHTTQENILGVNKNSKYVEESVFFQLKYATNDEKNYEMCYYWGVPAYKPLQYANAMEDTFQRQLQWGGLARIKGFSPWPELAEGVHEFPRHQGLKFDEFHDTAAAYLSRCFSDERADLKQMMDEAVKKINAEFAKGYD
jgi:ABC-type glycerol-3-phosphate transport system substrate-binding protein